MEGMLPSEKLTYARELLRNVSHELLILRRQNEIMGAQLEIVAIFDRAIRAQVPPFEQASAPDIAWEIDRFLKGSE